MPHDGVSPQAPDTPDDKPRSSVEAALEKARAKQVMTDDEQPVKLAGHPADDPDASGPGEEEGEGSEPSEEEEEGDKQEGEESDEEAQKKLNLKHKSLEAANKAVQAAERKMHAATEEAARLRKEVEMLRKQQVESQEKIAERASELTEEAMEAFTEKVLGEMQELDPRDPDYRKKMAKLWGKIHAEREKQFSKALKQAAREAAKEVLEQETQQAQERLERTRLWEKCNRMAAKAGLEMEDLGVDDDGRPIRSDDYLLFWRTAPDAPDDLDEDGKIEWTIREVKRITGRKVKAVKEKDERVRKIQERQQPLGRGSAGPPLTDKENQVRPTSLHSALEKAKASRRI